MRAAPVHPRSLAMTRTRPGPDERPQNRLLASLPAADFGRLLPDLLTIVTQPKQVLHRRGEPLQYVFFPNRGVASVTTVLSDGAMVEAATVGDEGMLGLEAVFGDRAVSTGDTIVHVADASVERLPVEAFRRELARQGALHALMGRYAQVMVAQMMQCAACNVIHHVNERCCRRLLMTHDRMHQRDFHLSHEFLAVMLGVRRQTVTVVARTLQRAGLISYRHGHVHVIDRQGLEAAACECYALIRSQFDRLRA
jgi:CRP-like cAMP-binding protein